jgi:hypothetical protein
VLFWIEEEEEDDGEGVRARVMMFVSVLIPS